MDHFLDWFVQNSVVVCHRWTEGTNRIWLSVLN